MQPTTVYVERARTCCVKPGVSTILGVVTGALFIGALAVLLSYDPGCDCDLNSDECCINSKDSYRCDEDDYRCYCKNRRTGEEFCRTEGLKGGSLAFFIILITLGVISLVFASMTCCCYNKLATRMTWVSVTGRPGFGVVTGNPTPVVPPQQSQNSVIPMREAEVTKVVD